MIGLGWQIGYFRDRTGRFPSPAEVATVRAGAPIWHNFSPAESQFDAPDRCLYFYDNQLSEYELVQSAIVANLKRYPRRVVALISEPNNTEFSGQSMAPEACGVRLMEMWRFVKLHCPQVEVFGPILAQAFVPGVVDPITYLKNMLRFLVVSYPDSYQMLRELGLGLNHYRRGRDAVGWAVALQGEIGRLKVVAAQFGMRQDVLLGEFGSPTGEGWEQETTAGYLRAVMPLIQSCVKYAFYFCAPFAHEPGRGFNGAGDTHMLSAGGIYTLTTVGQVLGLAGNIEPPPPPPRYDLEIPLPVELLRRATGTGSGARVAVDMTAEEVAAVIAGIRQVQR